MDFDKLLEEFLRLPKTLDEAIEYVKKNPVMNSTIEDMAFKQTVINVLILAGLVSENDFNASVEHFKNHLYEEFGKELLRESIEFEEKEKQLQEENDEDTDWDDEFPPDKKYYDA